MKKAVRAPEMLKFLLPDGNLYYAHSHCATLDMSVTHTYTTNIANHHLAFTSAHTC